MDSEQEGKQTDRSQWQRLGDLLLTRENVYALLLCLLALALMVVTTDAAPTWIYQGF